MYRNDLLLCAFRVIYTLPKGKEHIKMLNERNTYFEKLMRLGREYEDKRKALEEKKLALIEKYGWDSDEVKAWYDVRHNMEYPVSQGACKAYRAWKNSLDRGLNDVEMDDFLWDKEVSDFVETLRKAGIMNFIYTNQSTAMMDNLHDLEKEGCIMEGLCKREETEKGFGKERIVEIRGVHFTVC